MNRDLSGISTYISDEVSGAAAEGRKRRHITFQEAETSKEGHHSKRTEPKLAYGANTGKASRPKDADDRVHSLERENLKLKAKENLLELEIKK